MKVSDLKSSLSSKQGDAEKLALARKVGLYLVESDDEAEDRNVVEEVAYTLACDISVEVRQTLAFELRRASPLPRELAECIARDVAEVASPFLAQTEAFDPEDLAALARELDESLRITIARRRHVPGVVAAAIAETGGERSVTFLIRNSGADLDDASQSILDRFYGNRKLMDYLSERTDLPLAVVDRLVEHVSQTCRHALVERYGLDPERAEVYSEAARAGGLARWVMEASRGRLNEYIRQLESRGALTDRFLADVTRYGGVRFFESVMAYRTGIDLERVEEIVRRGHPDYSQRLLKKAGFKGAAVKKLGAALNDGLRRLENGDETDPGAAGEK